MDKLNHCINKIIEFNDLANRTKTDVHLYAQRKAVMEELEEFFMAPSNSEVELDAICDLLVTCLGMITLMGSRYKVGQHKIDSLENLLVLDDSDSHLSFESHCFKAVHYLLKDRKLNKYYDIPGALNYICDNNLQKKCTNDHLETKEKYSAIGVKIDFCKGVMPICVGYYSDASKKTKEKYFLGKILKSASWQEPNLISYIN